MTHAILWLGKLHLLILHFPVALAIVAAVADWWPSRPEAPPWRRSVVARPFMRTVLALAALTSVPVAICGWLFAAGGAGADVPGLLLWHRWAGTATAVVLVAAAVLTDDEAMRYTRSWWSRGLVLLGALGVTLTGHLGGLMVHGVNFLEW